MTKQILTLIGVSILLAIVINLIHPEGLPWVEDWAARVEAQAVREKVALVQLSDMLKFMRDGYLDRYEFRELKHELNRASKRIYRMKHNDRYRYSRYPY